jgi:hypothetical protein
MSTTLARRPVTFAASGARHTRTEFYGAGTTYHGAFLSDAKTGYMATTGSSAIFVTGENNADLAVAVGSLTAEIAQLRAAVQMLSEKLASFEDAASSKGRRRKVPKVTDAAARSKIKDFFEARHGETVYPSDVADDVGLDYERAVRLIHELEENGQVTRA